MASLWKTIGSVLAASAALVAILVFITGRTSLPSLFGGASTKSPQTASPTLAPTDSLTAQSVQPSSELLLDEVLRTLSNKNLTSLQKAQFRRRTEGKSLRWKVIVREVKQPQETLPNGNILVIFIPPSQAEKSFPDVLAASFPSTAETDLASLHRGDVISIQGRLQFLSLGESFSPTLEDCELLTVSPRS